MTRLSFLAVVPALVPAAPALAQIQPVRVVNANPVTAVGLYLRAVGLEEWGGNLLGANRLPPGAFLSVQPGEGSGCLFDMRLVMRDGREAQRGNVDVCGQRVVTMVLDTPPPAAAAPLPLPPAAPADLQRGRP
jgi:hypothetical protein